MEVPLSPPCVLLLSTDAGWAGPVSQSVQDLTHVVCTSKPIELCDGAGDPSDAVVVVVEKGSERIAKRFTFAMSTLLSHNSTHGIECRWWDE